MDFILPVTTRKEKTQMKIDEALRQQAKAGAFAAREDVSYMTGGLAPDADGKAFRFFHDSENPRSYLVISKEDVIGDVYQLTEMERTQKGFVGEPVYRIGVAHGTKVTSVDITIEKIGETLAAEMYRVVVPGQCYGSKSCTNRCCRGKDNGKCGCSSCCIAVASDVM